MPGNILWQSGAVQSLSMQASGQGSQLTNGSAVALSVNLNNTGASGGPALFGVAELVCSASGFGAAVTNTSTLDLYLALSRDGVNFATISTSGQSPQTYRGTFTSPISGNVSRMSMVVEGIPLMPDLYVGYLKNNTGQTLTSGWSLFMDLHNGAYT